MEALFGFFKSIRSLKIVLFSYSVLFGLFLKIPYVQGLVEQLPAKYKTTFEISGIFCSILSMLLIFEFFIKIFTAKLQQHNRPKVLKSLTSVEKEILRGFVFGNNRTQFFRISSGEINHLVAIKVIYRASTVSQMGDVFAYNIQPWALEYLSKNPHLIDGREVDIEHLQDPLGGY